MGSGKKERERSRSRERDTERKRRRERRSRYELFWITDIFLSKYRIIMFIFDPGQGVQSQNDDVHAVEKGG